MQMIPLAEAIGQGDCEAAIGRLENETREISGKMNDVLARRPRNRERLVQDHWRAHIRDACGLHHAATLCNASGSRDAFN